MMYRALVLGALAAPLALAAPVDVVKRQDIDTTILQFALTLEHLENVFYKQALKNFTQAQFAAAGFGPNYYNNLNYIASDEESHVKFLSTALTAAGATPNAACTYKFPYTDVKSFITLSTVLEGVGTSAYLGGAGLITNKDYLTAAGSILVTEALHTSLQRNSIGAIPFATPYGTPLEPTSVYSLAAAFIVSCPSSNSPLPFTPYPALTYDGTPAFGEEPNLAFTVAKRDANGWEGYYTSSAAPVYTSSTCTKSKKSTYAPVPVSSSTYAPAPSSYAPAPSSTYAPSSHAPSSTYAPSSYAPAPSSTYAPSSHAPSSTYAPSSYAPAPSSTYAPAPSPVAVAPLAGSMVSYTAASNVPTGSFLTFVSGLTVVSVAGQISGMKISAAIPSGVAGQTYVFVTKSAATGNKLDTSSILFGPSILEVKPAPPSIDFSYLKN